MKLHKFLFILLIIINFSSCSNNYYNSYEIKNITFKITQINLLGFTEYFYVINNKQITIDSIINETDFKRVYTKKININEYKKIAVILPELIKLDSVYINDSVIDGIDDEICIYNKNKEIKKITISNSKISIIDSLYFNINKLIINKSLMLLSL
ncbi:MAG TPA: hypothetical protein PKZ43_00045 [Bacteroidales bacterium]|nr:hypothetical protein [Bacteroidales bacterium]